MLLIHVSENKTAAKSVLPLKFRNYHWSSYTQFPKVSSSSASSTSRNTGPDAQTQKETGLKGTATTNNTGKYTDSVWEVDKLPTKCMCGENIFTLCLVYVSRISHHM